MGWGDFDMSGPKTILIYKTRRWSFSCGWRSRCTYQVIEKGRILFPNFVFFVDNPFFQRVIKPRFRFSAISNTGRRRLRWNSQRRGSWQIHDVSWRALYVQSATLKTQRKISIVMSLLRFVPRLLLAIFYVRIFKQKDYSKTEIALINRYVATSR